MRVLLDENLPEGLVEPLRLLGHTVDSVASLRLKGLDKGRLYREVASAYDLFFTKDREFANRVSTPAEPAPVRVILTVIRQQPGTSGAPPATPLVPRLTASCGDRASRAARSP